MPAKVGREPTTQGETIREVQSKVSKWVYGANALESKMVQTQWRKVKQSKCVKKENGWNMKQPRFSHKTNNCSAFNGLNQTFCRYLQFSIKSFWKHLNIFSGPIEFSVDKGRCPHNLIYVSWWKHIMKALRGLNRTKWICEVHATQICASFNLLSEGKWILV